MNSDQFRGRWERDHTYSIIYPYVLRYGFGWLIHVGDNIIEE